MRTRATTIALAVAAAVGLLAGNALAAPEITIETPAAGTTIDRSDTPQIQLSGPVSFDTPVPTDRDVYLRYDGSGSSCGHAYLSDIDGSDPGNSCSNLLNFLSVTPTEDDFSESFPAEEVALPMTIDASRNITGTIYMRSNLNEPSWQNIDVEVVLGNTPLRQSFDDGLPQANSHRTFNLNIDIPASLDKVDINFITVNLYYQTQVGLVWPELDNPASFISVPAFSTSFNRVVQVGVNTGQFTTAGVTVSPDFTTWSATVPTPVPGVHSLKARAVQGGNTSTVAQRTVTVVA